MQVVPCIWAVVNLLLYTMLMHVLLTCLLACGERCEYVHVQCQAIYAPLSVLFTPPLLRDVCCFSVLVVTCCGGLRQAVASTFAL